MEQTQKSTKAAEETHRDQQISQGEKTKGTKFNQGEKMPQPGQEQAINTFKATSSRKKGRIIHSLPRCRTETGTRRKQRRRQAAGPRGIEQCLCPARNWPVSGDRLLGSCLKWDVLQAFPRLPGLGPFRDHQSLAGLHCC